MMVIEGDPGDPVFSGRVVVPAPLNNWSGSILSNLLSVQVLIGVQASGGWQVNLAVDPFAPGTYDDAGLAQPFPSAPGLRVEQFNGTMCTKVRGRFVIHQFVMGSPGFVTSLLATFEQHCNGSATAVRGCVSYVGY